MAKTTKAFKQYHNIDPSFPMTIRHHHDSINFPPHYHKQLEVLYIIEGTLSVEVNHVLYKLKTGDLMMIGANHIHSYNNKATNDQASYYMLIFDWHYLDAISKDQQSYEDLYPVLLKLNLLHTLDYPIIKNRLQPLIREMNEESHWKMKGYKLLVISHLYEFLTLVTRELDTVTRTHQEVKSLKKENWFISTINDYIYNNYTRELTLEEIALVTGYSTYHFTRLFKKYTGFTFKQYLANFRVNMVKEELYDETISITDMAFKHGFNSIKSFNRCFKDITGTSPREFKKVIHQIQPSTIIQNSKK